jgi:hypothetical protein
MVVTITKTVMIPVGLTRINMSYDYPCQDGNIYAVSPNMYINVRIQLLTSRPQNTTPFLHVTLYNETQ